MKAIATRPLKPGEVPADRIVLDAEARHIRRKLLTAQSGLEFLVDFPLAAHLHDGEALVLEDQSLIAIEAAKENLMEVTVPNIADLTKLAWHIGNRHLEAQIEPTRILLKRDAVIASMLRQLGATVREVKEKFQPEHGAYHGHAH
jgi:urease accessory protein